MSTSYNLENIIKRAKTINENPLILFDQFIEISLDNIDDIKPGTYRLKKIPTIKQIKEFPFYKGSNSEIGLICYHGVWIIHIASEGAREVQFPIDIKALAYMGDLDFFLHSHPPLQGDIHYWLPSINDLDFSKSTHSLTQFISTDRGLVKLKVVNRDISYAEKFRKYAFDEVHGNYDTFKLLYNNLMHRFCSLYQNYSITNWSELNPEDTIDTLMETLTVNSIKNEEIR